MGMLAWIMGTIGALCMVMGIGTVLEVVPPLGAEFTWTFWFMLSSILILLSIAFAVGRGRETEM